jgi:hypothetical protein
MNEPPHEPPRIVDYEHRRPVPRGRSWTRRVFVAVGVVAGCIVIVRLIATWRNDDLNNFSVLYLLAAVALYFGVTALRRYTRRKRQRPPRARRS